MEAAGGLPSVALRFAQTHWLGMPALGELPGAQLPLPMRAFLPLLPQAAPCAVTSQMGSTISDNGEHSTGFLEGAHEDAQRASHMRRLLNKHISNTK